MRLYKQKFKAINFWFNTINTTDKKKLTLHFLPYVRSNCSYFMDLHVTIYSKDSL